MQTTASVNHIAKIGASWQGAMTQELAHEKGSCRVAKDLVGVVPRQHSFSDVGLAYRAFFNVAFFDLHVPSWSVTETSWPVLVVGQWYPVIFLITSTTTKL